MVPAQGGFLLRLLRVVAGGATWAAASRATAAALLLLPSKRGYDFGQACHF